ncbi:MAG: glycosyltransferase [Pseudomonadota bacterium]
MNEKKPINKKLKVLQLLPALHSGGIEASVINIVKFFSENNNIEVHIASNGGELQHELPDNVKHFSLNLDHKSIGNLMQATKKLARIINRERYDIVHVHSRFPAWVLYFTKKKVEHDFKVISTIHSAHSQQFLLKKIYNNQLAKADMVTTVSKFMQNYLIEQWNLPQKPKLTYCGVDFNRLIGGNITKYDKLKAIAKEQFILLPGRISPKKGHHLLMQSFARLNNREQYRLLFVGKIQSDKYFNNLRTLAKALQIEHLVYFHPAIIDIAELYRQASLVVVPSVKPEAFGLVTAEAQYAGALVLATNIGASPELIEHNFNGYLCQPNITNLSQQLKHCLDLPNFLRQRITTNAKIRATAYNYQHTLQQLQQLYFQLCPKRELQPA